jgi:hypothetical protein
MSGGQEAVENLLTAAEAALAEPAKSPAIVMADPVQPDSAAPAADNPGRMQVATFTLDGAEDLSGKLLAFHIGQFRPLYYNVGRFRLSVTTAPGPHKARMPIVIVPKLGQ